METLEVGIEKSGCADLLCLVEDEVFVVGEQVVVGHATVGGGPDDGGAVSSLEVRLHDLVVTTVTEKIMSD